ncbi:MAG: DUF6051 family protein [Ignavibacteria bacterium]
MKHLPYLELYNLLKKYFASSGRDIPVPELGIKITRNIFHSKGAAILPGKKSYSCREHDVSFEADPADEGMFDKEERSILEIHDSDFICNEEFDYIIIDEENPRESKSAILLFHGLNEKKWDKYLPWAYRLLKNTGKPVILFPLAFHMDRAPKEWSVAAHMNTAAKERAHHSQANSHTSFVNAAISSRLEANPQRFFWTGLQSYIDVTTLLHDITHGRVKGISKGAEVDIFGYSIGAYFSVILLMAGAGGLVNNSKLFAFCGGPTLDRMYPISKYILDAKAASAIGSYYLEHLNNDFHGNTRLQHYLGERHPEEGYFKSMLLYHHYKEERENRLRETASRIYAVALKQDTVIPPVELLNTLKGEMRDIDIRVDIEDFSYPYSHVNPFSLAEKYSEETDIAFIKIMDKASGFLGKA